ncbi:MAG: hypothetical protein ACUVS6_11735 [Anaerolineae bacterium]
MNEALNQGLTIVYQKEYPYDLTDATAIVADIAKSGADFVVHCPYFTDGILFAKTFRKTGNISGVRRWHGRFGLHRSRID